MSQTPKNLGMIVFMPLGESVRRTRFSKASATAQTVYGQIIVDSTTTGNVTTGAAIQIIPYQGDAGVGMRSAVSFTSQVDASEVLVVLVDELGEVNPENTNRVLSTELDSAVNFVIVIVLGWYDEERAEELREILGVDVLRREDLDNPTVALRKIGPWAES